MSEGSREQSLLSRRLASATKLFGALIKDRLGEAPEPLVTVVIPLFNEQHFIEAAIDSVASQSYRRFECLIVNDCSTDRSRERAATRISGDERFRIIDREQNGGLAASRNTGLTAAQGPLITFLDADDCLLPLSLWHRVRAFEDVVDRSVAGVVCRVKRVGEEWRFAPSSLVRGLITEPGPDIDFISGGPECPFPTHAALLRTEIVRSFGGFDESMRFGAEDWDLWNRMLRHGYRFRPTGVLGAIYRQKQGSMVRRMPGAHLREGVRLIRSAYQSFPEELILPGAPYVFTEPLSHYQRAIAEARRVVTYAAYCHLAGDEAGYREALEILEPGSGAFLLRHVDVDAVLRSAILRFSAREGPELSPDEQSALDRVASDLHRRLGPAYS